MSVDVEIYLSQLLKFFKENPDDLLSLIPKGKEEDFFEKLREVVNFNHEKGEEIALTHQQMTDICVEINKGKPIEKDEFEILLEKGLFLKAPLGFICLN